MDQRDPRQLDRLGDALGALIEEVATSKVDFLVRAAESDGFFFADRVFRPAETTANVFAVIRVEDFASIDDRARRLHLLANDSPKDAIAGAKELVESLCRTVLRLLGESLPKKAADLARIVKITLDAVGPVSVDSDDREEDAELVRTCLRQLGALVVTLGEPQNISGSGRGSNGDRKRPSTSRARLTVGAAVAFARFIAETYAERTALGTVGVAVSGRRRKETR